MIIWGFRNTTKLLCMTIAYLCGRCNNVNPFRVIKVTRWFCLFFIPTIPYSFKYYVVCPVCGQANMLTKEQALETAAQAAQAAPGQGQVTGNVAQPAR